MTETRKSRSLKICLLLTGESSTADKGLYQAFEQSFAELGHKVDVLSGPPYPQLDEKVRLHKILSLDLYNLGISSAWKR